MLAEGEYRAGDKLPNQTEFAKQLGVSRLSLREALNNLSLMGVIRQNPGSGTVILSDDTRLWGERPPPPMLSDIEATRELLESRKAIETAIVGLAIRRIHQDEVALLAEDVENMKRSLERNETQQYLKLDMSFHFHIANASHNRYMIHMFVTIRSLMEEFMTEVFTVIPELVNSSLHYHERVFNSIKTGEGAQAVCDMEEHIANIEEALRAYYQRSAKHETIP